MITVSDKKKYLLSIFPFNFFQYTKQFTGLINAEFQYESDNDYIDLYSYWQKIKQNTINTIPYTLPLPSSVRKSSAKLVIKPTLWELKQVALKIKLCK